ncbi:uncharacterized protein LOC122382099 [Amphibalanus amphitrite]|uniref:uncharacterized protein LOC122382099 n=1 Tax=Amphibalanus amphitrite TaxID=1232801 RepID=UPI001C920043|nr:uncharacterized protein LOC122382099 [Amphibalanus amphitrite]
MTIPRCPRLGLLETLALMMLMSSTVTSMMEEKLSGLPDLPEPVDTATNQPAPPTPKQTESKAGPILIKDQGIMPLHKDDMVLTFYLTVLNNGGGPLELRAEMKLCCQHFSVQDAECESMVLIGGYMGILTPGHTTNITLLYPNLYIYNRVGECEITIRYNDHSFQHTVQFNTTVSRYGPVSAVMEDYYSPYDVSSCVSVDQDPLNGCAAVNCFHKYNGHRNYFNPSKLRCTPVPRCDSAKPQNPGALPTMAYVPESNQCRQLMSALTEEDLQFFHDSAKGEVLRFDKNRPQKVECHHGRPDDDLWCVCDRGWMSSHLDRASAQAPPPVYHMCNIKVVRPADELAQNRAASNWLFTLAIGSVIVGVVCIALSLYCVQWWMDRRHRSAKATSEELAPLTGTADSLSPRGEDTGRSSGASDLSRRRPTGFEPRASPSVTRRVSADGAKSVRIASQPTVYEREDTLTPSNLTQSGTQ